MIRFNFDVTKACQASVDEETIRAHEAHARSLGLPPLESIPRPRYPRLAIVGGGPSVRRHVNVLRNWKGSVWAVNDAALWCARANIKCTFFTVDPTRDFKPELRHVVRRAILSARCDPWLFDFLRDADIWLYDLPPQQLGPGSAAAACSMGTRYAGFTDVTFFGCEGSFENERYAFDYTDSVEGFEFIVECAGQRFITNPGLMLTARCIAWTLKDHPRHVHNRSGGLLDALVKDPDFHVVGVSPKLAAPGTPKIMIDNYLAHIQALRNQHEGSHHPDSGAAGREADNAQEGYARQHPFHVGQ